jgi:hypothetical protein
MLDQFGSYIADFGRPDDDRCEILLPAECGVESDSSLNILHGYLTVTL